MITKERLEELIEQGATIYKLTKFSFREIKLDKCNVVMNGGLYISKDSVGRFAWIEDLFETEEEAREHLEFGNITRTERLELPSWEEFNSTKFSYWFMGKNGKEYHLHNVADEIYIGEKFEIVFNKPLTRENYNEARRICVKLFKGEEIDGKTNNKK